MEFGSYGATDSVQEHLFRKEPGWYWNVKVATWRQEVARSKMLSDVEYVSRPGEDGVRETRSRNTISNAEIMTYEIWSTFAGSNIPGDGDGKLFFTEKMDRPQFEDALKQLPVPMVREIYGFILKTNPQWGPDWNVEEEATFQ